MLKGEFINDPKSSPAMKMISRLFFDEVRDPGKGYICTNLSKRIHYIFP